MCSHQQVYYRNHALSIFSAGRVFGNHSFAHRFQFQLHYWTYVRSVHFREAPKRFNVLLFALNGLCRNGLGNNKIRLLECCDFAKKLKIKLNIRHLLRSYRTRFDML